MTLDLETSINLSADPSDFALNLTRAVWQTDRVIRGLERADRLVHCHIPKTAGVTFYEQFKRHLPSFHADHRKTSESLYAFFESPIRARTTFLTGHFKSCDVVDRLGGTALVVCPIRHPLDRLISHYRYNSSQAHTWHESFRERFPSFDVFLADDTFSNNPMTRQLFSGLCCTSEGFLTRTGKRVLFGFATQAHLDDFITELKTAFAIPHKPDEIIETLNVTSTSSPPLSASDLSPEALSLFKARNAIDLALFDAVHSAENTRFLLY